jgi:large subunit ribosomal protein L17
MRHLKATWKLGRNTSHRRALLRNLVSSLILEERIETTVSKAKAMRPHVEKMITFGKRGDLHARRQAAAYLTSREAVDRLFADVAPRYGDRNGGYLRIVRTGFRKGDGGEKAFIELIGSEKILDERREKRAEVRAKRREEMEKAMQEQQTNIEASGGPAAGEGGQGASE